MTARKAVSIVLLSLLATTVAGRADAQFLKGLFGKKKHKYSQNITTKSDSTATPPPHKLSRKEQRKKQKEDRKKQRLERKNAGKKKPDTTKKPARPQPLGAKRKLEVQYPTSQLKPHYRIDVLVPIYLDDLVRGEGVTYKDKIPEKAVQGTAFYEGVVLAADSLKRAGFNLDIYVHDVGSFSETTDMLLNGRKLDSTDLIIGAVQSRDVPTLAGYARRKHVNFISALSPADGSVKDNPYFTLLQPSLRSHCEWIAADIAKKFPGQKIAMLYRTSVQADDNAYKYFNDAPAGVQFNKLLCNALPTHAALASVFDTAHPNVVVVPILDIIYADSLMKRLTREFPGTHFEVYGMPPWNGITDLRKSHAFPNLTVKVTYPFNLEPADSGAAAYVAHTYHKDYGGKPTELVYRGYETMFWYATLLRKYGTIFNPNYSDNNASSFTHYDIKPVWDKFGGLLYNENRRIYLSTYEGGEFKTE